MITISQQEFEDEREFYVLNSLYSDVFSGNLNRLMTFQELTSQNNLISLIAYEDDVPVGFKVGYCLPKDPGTLYSWIGGTKPSSRKHGIAWSLMLRQHELAKAQGLQAVETKCRPKWEAMMRLNYKAGFVLLKKYTGAKCGTAKFHLRKELN